jgi:putative ABC transport system permease protein
MIKATLKGLVAHKLRFVMTALAVTLGVAFMAGTMVYGDTLVHGFDTLMATGYENTAVVVRSPQVFETQFSDQREPLDDSIAATLSKVEGVRAAEGFAEGYAQLVDRNGKAIGMRVGPPTLGDSWATTPELNPWVIEPGGTPPTGAHDVVIDLRSAKLGHLKVGEQVTVLSRAAPESFTVTGVARWGDAESPLGASISMFRLDVAERLAGTPGKVNQIRVVAEEGVSEEEMRDRVLAALPDAELEVVTGSAIIAENQKAARSALGFFNTFLLVFALIALFVGSFIIFNTFSIIVAQRTRELGLLRAIGASRRQVMGSVAAEAMVLAVLASTLGLGAGILLAEGLRSLLGSVGLDMPGVRTEVLPSSMLIAFAAGIVVTLLAAVWPARRAASIPPMAALRDVSVEPTGHSGRRLAAGSTVVGIGAIAMALGLFVDMESPLPLVGTGAALVFLGVAVLGPVIAKPIVSVLAWPLPRVRGMTGLLARQNAVRNPKRTSATASALMVGVALVALITIIASSAKASIHESLDQRLRADFVAAASQMGYGGFSPELSQRISVLPEVAQTTGVRFGPAKIAGGTRMVAGVNPRAIDAMWDINVRDGDLFNLSDVGVAVAKETADAHGWTIGSLVPITFARTGVDDLRVEAIFDHIDEIDDFVVNMHAYDRNFVQPLDMQVYVKLYDNVDPQAARAAIERVVAAYPNVSLLDKSEFGDSYAATLDQMLNLVYALLALAIVIALIGIANTLALSIHERTRELGLLRAVGLARSQLRAVVRWEAVAISLLGALLGLGVGCVFGWALVVALDSQGITTLAIPIVPLVVLVAIAWVAGVVASLRPSWRASRLDILEAIAAQ